MNYKLRDCELGKWCSKMQRQKQDVKDECKQQNHTYNETTLFNNNFAVTIWYCGKQQAASTK